MKREKTRQGTDTWCQTTRDTTTTVASRPLFHLPADTDSGSNVLQVQWTGARHKQQQAPERAWGPSVRGVQYSTVQYSTVLGMARPGTHGKESDYCAQFQTVLYITMVETWYTCCSYFKNLDFYTQGLNKKSLHETHSCLQQPATTTHTVQYRTVQNVQHNSGQGGNGLVSYRGRRHSR